MYCAVSTFRCAIRTAAAHDVIVSPVHLPTPITALPSQSPSTWLRDCFVTLVSLIFDASIPSFLIHSHILHQDALCYAEPDRLSKALAAKEARAAAKARDAPLTPEEKEEKKLEAAERAELGKKKKAWTDSLKEWTGGDSYRGKSFPDGTKVSHGIALPSNDPS